MLSSLAVFQRRVINLGIGYAITFRQTGIFSPAIKLFVHPFFMLRIGMLFWGFWHF